VLQAVSEDDDGLGGEEVKSHTIADVPNVISQ
jgi:hypothetical protein